MAVPVKLTVPGELVAHLNHAIFLNIMSGGRINTGQSASIIRAAGTGAGMSGTGTGNPSVNNAGELLGGYGAYFSFSTAAPNVVSNVVLANSGVIVGDVTLGSYRVSLSWVRRSKSLASWRSCNCSAKGP